MLQQRPQHKVVADLGRDVQRRALVGPRAAVQHAWLAAEGALDRRQVAAADVHEEGCRYGAHRGAPPRQAGGAVLRQSRVHSGRIAQRNNGACDRGRGGRRRHINMLVFVWNAASPRGPRPRTMLSGAQLLQARPNLVPLAVCSGCLGRWPLLIGSLIHSQHAVAPGPGTMGKKSHPLAARIKRVMQADEDVGKIAQATPFLMGGSRNNGCDLGGHQHGSSSPWSMANWHQLWLSFRHTERALELFLQQLCERAAAVAQDRGAKTVTPSHV